MKPFKEPVEIMPLAKFMTSQTVGNILATRPQILKPNGDTVDGVVTQFVIGSASLHNRSGASSINGIGGRIPIDLWEAGQWDDSEYAAGTVFADDTTDAQDAGTSDFTLDTVSTNNDGFLLACDIPFNIISVMVGTASVSNTAWKLYYSKATAGTGFSNNYTEIKNALVKPSFGSTGEQLIWFQPPQDWVKATSGTAIQDRHGATVPEKFLLLIKSTSAPDTTAGLASLFILGRMYYSTAGVADKATFLRTEEESEMPIAPQLDALVCATSIISTEGSRATVTFRMKA